MAEEHRSIVRREHRTGGKILKNTCVSFGCCPASLNNGMRWLSHGIPRLRRDASSYFSKASPASHFLPARLERYERKFVVFVAGPWLLAGNKSAALNDSVALSLACLLNDIKQK